MGWGSKIQAEGIIALTDAATITSDGNQESTFTVTLSGDRVLANPSVIRPGVFYTYIFTQGAGGNHVLSYDSCFRWPNSAILPLSTGEGDVDIITFLADGTYLNFVSIQKNLGIAPYLDPTLGVPANLVASTDEVGQITLTWEDTATDETSYDISRFDDQLFFVWVDNYDTVGPGIETYTDNAPGALDADQQYRVRTRKGQAYSAWSDVAIGQALS